MEDGPTIGLVLCDGKNRVVAEYALRDTNRPIGVAEYQVIDGQGTWLGVAWRSGPGG